MKTCVLMAAAFAALASSCAEVLELRMESGEKWWGGAVVDADKQPFDESTVLVGDMLRRNYGNPAMPFFLSSHGRCLRGDSPFRYVVSNGTIRVEGVGVRFDAGRVATDLPGAYRWCRDRFFPPSGKMPDESLFTAPQYNTWIELQYNQNEKDVLAYAAAVKANGFPAGVMMIDDTWQIGYGTWEFDPRRFADARGMCDRLHRDGFKVMLWMCPFVSADTPAYRKLRTEGGLFLCSNYIRDGDYPVYVKPGSEPDPALFRWWNGKSAQVDLTHPNGVKWMTDVLDGLVRDFGVDGFKLDAGDLCYFHAENTYRVMRPFVAHEKTAGPAELAAAYSSIGLRYPLNEYRTVWGHQGQPIAVRLADKRHRWNEVARLIPQMVATGLAGYPFVCPDMIGGGQYVSFLPGSEFDPELFVRSAQVHALSPMMQFSAAPWRVLDGRHLVAVKKCVEIRMHLTPYVMEVARISAKTGDPMLRSLAFEYPGQGFEKVTDQFLLGHRLLVAPQVKKGADRRKVRIPAGRWMSDDGRGVDGPCEVDEATPLERLPYFILQERR